MSRPSSDAILETIGNFVGQPNLTIETVAVELHTSRSQVQRALAEKGLRFSSELREARLIRAAEYLIEEDLGVAETAAKVGLSPDHLRVIFKETWGIGPGQLRRMVQRLEGINRWRQRVPPRHGTPGYWEQRRSWLKARRQIGALHSMIRPDTPLAAWGAKQLELSRWDDHRRQPHRDRILAERRKEHQQLQALLSSVLGDIGGGTFDPRERRAA